MNPRDESLQPIDSSVYPRFTQIATFMRAQHRESAAGLDIAMVGVPFDWGSTNRAGARHGPAQIREMSRLIRRVHFVSRISPFEIARVADVGDAPVNPLDLAGTYESVEAFFDGILGHGTLPLSVGGDHAITLPILRALAKKTGPIGMLQFDAHSDTYDTLVDDSFGGRYNHGTCFRRAIEEGALDPKRLVQVGIRGSMFHADQNDWALAQGVTIIDIETFFDIGVKKTIEKARKVLGNKPAYITLDIDGLDPTSFPGTGAPEPGGLSMRDAQVILRGMQGLDLWGADVNECSPPLDPTGMTALNCANLLFEELCLLADTVERRRAKGGAGQRKPKARVTTKRARR